MQRQQPQSSDVKIFIVYFSVGLISLTTALFVSMKFLSRVKAQPNSKPATVLPQKSQPSLAAPKAPPSDADLLPTPTDPALTVNQVSPDGAAALPKAAVPTAKTMLDSIIEDFNYEVSGRRDPFLPYTAPRPVSVDEEDEVVSPLQRFDLDQLTLVGIIWDVKKPKAMFLDPQGKGYIVNKLDKIGRQRGYVAEIREGEVVVLERYVGEGRSSFQTKSFRLIRE